MPALRFCSRRWRLGDDDLAIPSALALLVRIYWAVVGLLAVQSMSDSNSEDCDIHHDGDVVFRVADMNARDSARLFLWCLVGVSFASLTLMLTISLVSLRGTLMNPLGRKILPYLLYIRVLLFLLECVVCGVSVVVVLHSHVLQCYHVSSVLIKALRGVSITMLMSVVSSLLFAFCIFDPTGGHGRGNFRDQMEWRNASRQNVDQQQSNYELLWLSRFNCFCSCISPEAHAYEEVGRMFARYFQNLDVVPSDVMAALVLVRKIQLDQDSEILHADTSQIRITIAPPIVGQKNSKSLESSPAQVENHPLRSRGANKRARVRENTTPNAVFLSANKPEDVNALQEATYFIRYAVAIYGWPMFVFMNPLLGCCRLCFRCCCGGSMPPAVDDNFCRLNSAAVQLSFGARPNTEVLYQNFENDFRLKPYLVIADHDKKTIILSIRGTLSLSDCLTDCLTTPIHTSLSIHDPRDPTSSTTTSSPTITAHAGIWTAAEHVVNHVIEKGILAEALRRNPGWTLLVVGHSLGAGVATLATLLLRRSEREPIFQNAQCIAFSPPPVVDDLAAENMNYVTSVVLGKDIVPRISHRSVRHLRDEMVHAVAHARTNKTRILCCGCVGCCCCCFQPLASTPTSALVDVSPISVNDGAPTQNNRRSAPSNPSPTIGVAETAPTADTTATATTTATTATTNTTIATSTNEMSPVKQPQQLRDPMLSKSSLTRDKHRLQRYVEVAEVHNAQDDSQFVPFRLAGRILHITKTETYARVLGIFPRKTRTYRATWASPDCFKRILISPAMLSEHLPDKVEAKLKDALAEMFRPS